MPNIGLGASRPRVHARVRLADAIAADLRERILNGTISGGMLPRQEDLVALYGVSAPPLREALRVLEVEGLITVRRGKIGGAEIHRPDGGSAAHACGMALQGEGVHLDDLAESLLMLEPMAAATCAARADRLGSLKESLDLNLAATKKAVGDGERFTQLSREFHEVIVDHLVNATTKLLIRSLVAIWSAQEVTWANQVTNDGRYPDVTRQRTVLQAHKRISARIFSGDQIGAERAARRHLQATQAIVLEHFGDRVVDAASPRAVEVLRNVAPSKSE